MRSLGGSMTRGRQLGNRKPVVGGDSADITSDMAVHLLFDGDVTDSSGNSNDFTEQGSPTYATGKKGNAIDLERSSSQYVSRAGFGVPAGSFSVSLWARPEANPPLFQHFCVAGVGDDFIGTVSDLTWAIYMSQSGSSLRGVISSDGSTKTFMGTEDYLLAEWQHIAMTYDSATGGAVFYLNGSSAGIATIGGGGALHSSSASCQIGSIGATSNRHFDGLIDEFRYYDRALTAADVSALYGGGTPP